MQFDVSDHEVEFALSRPLEVDGFVRNLRSPKRQSFEDILRSEQPTFIKEVRQLSSLPIHHLADLILNLGSILPGSQDVLLPNTSIYNKELSEFLEAYLKAGLVLHLNVGQQALWLVGTVDICCAQLEELVELNLDSVHSLSNVPI